MKAIPRPATWHLWGFSVKGQPYHLMGQDGEEMGTGSGGNRKQIPASSRSVQVHTVETLGGVDSFSHRLVAPLTGRHVSPGRHSLTLRRCLIPARPSLLLRCCSRYSAQGHKKASTTQGLKMQSQKAEAKQCFGCRPNARPRYWSDTLTRVQFGVEDH